MRNVKWYYLNKKKKKKGYARFTNMGLDHIYVCLAIIVLARFLRTSI